MPRGPFCHIRDREWAASCRVQSSTLVSTQTMDDDIRAIVKEHGRLSVDAIALPDEADLYQAGLTSHASVNLMLALEDKFEVEFPERMLNRRAFASIEALVSALDELGATAR